jgi:UDP-N-acetylglucosamine:LPS N-acetylglucosamine transferase
MMEALQRSLAQAPAHEVSSVVPVERADGGEPERAVATAEPWERRPRRPSERPTAARRKILAISSGGGHWVELLRLRPAFRGHFVVYVTVSEAYASQVPDCPLRVVSDATRWQRLGVARTALEVARVVLAERPDVVVSTGALPGFFGVLFGRLAGARTIWVDSLANVDELSMSGRWAGKIVDLWLTQWPELARPDGPRCEGSVIE